jgi:GTP-binding protein
VTRDRLYGVARLGEREVIVVDTGGIETNAADPLTRGVVSQAERAVQEADVVLYLMDAEAGVLPEDRDIYRKLCQGGRPLVVAVNKCDGDRRALEAVEVHRIGIDDYLTVSAAHGRNIGELSERLAALLPPPPEEPAPEPGQERPLHIAVIGRPNAGKSTLVNRLLGQERVLVSDIPGTTRDAIDVEVKLGERRCVLVDTAGLRRKRALTQALERSSVFMAIRALERADLALLLLDPTEGITHQDAQIAALIEHQERPCVILVNKWDALPGEVRGDTQYTRALYDSLRFLNYAPVLCVSAKSGRGLHRLPPVLEDLWKKFNKRIPTARLNTFLARTLEHHQPPAWRGAIVRLPYMTQVRTAPPTFVAFCNHAEGVAEDWKRYLKNRIREEFDLAGSPLKLLFRQKEDRRKGRRGEG